MNAQQVPQVPQGGGVEFERWSEAMRGEFDEFLHETWQAMNKARTGWAGGRIRRPVSSYCNRPRSSGRAEDSHAQQRHNRAT